jgi:hypothetical protein
MDVSLCLAERKERNIPIRKIQAPPEQPAEKQPDIFKNALFMRKKSGSTNSQIFLPNFQ